MKTNIFEKKYAEALICEDPAQGSKPIGMAIASIEILAYQKGDDADITDV